MPEVTYDFHPRPQQRRANIVLPNAAPQEPGFERNAANLQAPKQPPRPFPVFRRPGEVERIRAGMQAARGTP